jgi:hypothetical protein
MDMIQNKINRLEFLTKIIPPLLYSMNDLEFKFKYNPDKWSKQEILGHLIDSASNNHHRFVRSQFEDIPAITYDQDKWNRYNYYNKFDKEQLIEFWKSYNCQLLGLIKSIPLDDLSKMCNTGGQNNYTIEFLFNDYVEHLEHHLKQIILYE